MTANDIPPQTEAKDAPTPSPKPRWPRRILRAAASTLLIMLLLGMLAWSLLAIYFAGLHGRSPRLILACAFAAAALGAWVYLRRRRTRLLVSAGLFTIVLVWFFSLKPSNDRDWPAESAQVPSGEIDSNRLTIRNLRNFDYRSQTDFTPTWETRDYDLAALRTVDFMLVYFGPRAIAHAIVSFGFEDGQYLAVSIESRREKSEVFSPLQGLFRQYELYYVFSDERDVVRLRTNYRHEEVYIYRSTLTPAQSKQLLLSYVDHANALHREAQFYNSLTSNCATNVLDNARSGNLSARMTWRVILSGYAAEELYENKRIDTRLPFDELMARCHVNAAALKADRDPEFSKTIRIGLPMPPPLHPH